MGNLPAGALQSTRAIGNHPDRHGDRPLPLPGATRTAGPTRSPPDPAPPRPPGVSLDRDDPAVHDPHLRRSVGPVRV